MDNEEALSLVLRESRLYPKSAPPPETIEAYVEEFVSGDYDLAAVDLAFRRHRRVSSFWPTIAELTEALVSNALPLPSAEEAWAEVQAFVRKHGSYAGHPGWPEIEFSDPLIVRAVQAIGYQRIVQSEAPGVDRAHFLRVYDALVRRKQADVRFAGMSLPLPPPVVRPALDRPAGVVHLGEALPRLAPPGSGTGEEDRVNQTPEKRRKEFWERQPEDSRHDGNDR